MVRVFIVSLGLLLCVASMRAQAVVQIPKECAELTAQVRRAEATLKDWPALARYREANATLTPPAKGDSRVVFMGDSITDSWNNQRFGGFFAGKPYINRGISGQTTPQMLVRFRADVIALQPKVVVILAGTNDLAGNTGSTTLEAIENNLSSMAELASVHGIRVVLASVLPINDYESREGKRLIRSAQRSPEQIKALNSWIQNYARQKKFVYLDYYSSMIDTDGFLKNELSDDGLHPNKDGYGVMTPLADRAIAMALKKK